MIFRHTHCASKKLIKTPRIWSALPLPIHLLSFFLSKHIASKHSPSTKKEKRLTTEHQGQTFQTGLSPADPINFCVVGVIYLVIFKKSWNIRRLKFPINNVVRIQNKRTLGTLTTEEMFYFYLLFLFPRYLTELWLNLDDYREV